jgi:predicted acetyltransferase
MPDYRPVPDDRTLDFMRLATYAFNPTGGPFSDDELAERAEAGPAQLGEARGLFDGDDLLVGCVHHPLSMRVRGEYRDVGGVSAVASPPEHRRRGLVRDLLAASLAEYRDRGWQFAALWPFDYGFYRRMGWGTAHKRAEVKVEPGALAVADDARSGRFRAAGPDDWAVLDRVHRATYAGYDLALARTEAWWRNRVFESWRDDPYVYLVERDGVVVGYLVYQVRDGDDGREMRVGDLGYVDDDAYRNLLQFCYDHDSQVESVTLHGPEDASLLDRVDDPGRVEVRVETGAMFRLVDVARALESLAYPADADGSLALAVSDPLADWNDGTFRVAVGGDTAECVRDDDADPDVEADVAALSQVAAGYLSVADAARCSSLSVENPDAGDLLAAMLPGRDTYVTDGF